MAPGISVSKQPRSWIELGIKDDLLNSGRYLCCSNHWGRGTHEADFRVTGGAVDACCNAGLCPGWAAGEDVEERNLSPQGWDLLQSDKELHLLQQYDCVHQRGWPAAEALSDVPRSCRCRGRCRPKLHLHPGAGLGWRRAHLVCRGSAHSVVGNCSQGNRWKLQSRTSLSDR
jgi:hypothetical protein